MSTPILEFSNVTLVFDDVVALENISFRVLEGNSLVVLGATASGKSMLLKLSLGLFRPDAGQIYLFGEQISGMDEQDLFAIRRQVGMVFQESALFDSLTVAENVAYPLVSREEASLPPAEVEARVWEALRFVELEEAAAKLPSEISGGMRRRVAIARAIVHRPRLLLYDSPTEGLDPITAHTIMTLILKERDTQNVSSVLVTHRLQNARLLANFRFEAERRGLVPARGNGARRETQTRFVVLREGKLMFEGDQEELNRQQDPYIRNFVLRSD